MFLASTYGHFSINCRLVAVQSLYLKIKKKLGREHNSRYTPYPIAQSSHTLARDNRSSTYLLSYIAVNIIQYSDSQGLVLRYLEFLNKKIGDIKPANNNTFSSVGEDIMSSNTSIILTHLPSFLKLLLHLQTYFQHLNYSENL